jgi:hypothetical protein
MLGKYLPKNTNVAVATERAKRNLKVFVDYMKWS